MEVGSMPKRKHEIVRLSSEDDQYSLQQLRHERGRNVANQEKSQRSRVQTTSAWRDFLSTVWNSMKLAFPMKRSSSPLPTHNSKGTHSSATTRHHRRPISQPTPVAQSTNDLSDTGSKRNKSIYRRFLSCVRSTWTGVKSSIDSEFDDLDNPLYRRPKSLDHLVTVTHFSRLEIKRLYRAFKAECPTGLITEETFRAMYSQFFPKGGNGSQYPHYVFNSLTSDASGVLGFEDIVLVLSDLCRGPADKKLRWAFHIYDVDGDGVISRTELEDVALSISELTGDANNSDPTLATASVRHWVDRVFKKMDLNEDGTISMEEFLTVCLQDEMISRSLSIFSDVY